MDRSSAQHMSRLAALLAESTRPSLRWDRQQVVIRNITEKFAALCADETRRYDMVTVLETACSLIGKYDYRISATYLMAISAADDSLMEKFAELINNPADREWRVSRILATAYGPRFSRRPNEYQRLTNADAVFDRAADGPVFWAKNDKWSAAIEGLLQQWSGPLSEFIESQLDIPGPNARVRGGLVKFWALPGERLVASKRANATKPGGLRREQWARNQVRTRMYECGKPAEHGPGQEWSAGVIDDVAVIGEGDRMYSLSRWVAAPTLEDLLIANHDPVLRHRWLSVFRALLDVLFDRGLLWGDMSPRNILVKDDGPKIHLTLLDFEKTVIQEAPVSLSGRRAWCRGQIAIEELAVVSTADELLSCLDGYFDPRSWDEESRLPPTAPLRPDLRALIVGRGIEQPTAGQCDRLDREVLSVRLPFLDDENDNWVRPGQLGFSVEHYLTVGGYPAVATEYERMTTEVLIAARQHGLFEPVVKQLRTIIDAVEQAAVIDEFNQVLGACPGTGLSEHALKAMTSCLERLYAAATAGCATTLAALQLTSAGCGDTR